MKGNAVKVKIGEPYDILLVLTLALTLVLLTITG
jgi:hypothetical protein